MGKTDAYKSLRKEYSAKVVDFVAQNLDGATPEVISGPLHIIWEESIGGRKNPVICLRDDDASLCCLSEKIQNIQYMEYGQPLFHVPFLQDNEEEPKEREERFYEMVIEWVVMTNELNDILNNTSKPNSWQGVDQSVIEKYNRLENKYETASGAVQRICDVLGKVEGVKAVEIFEEVAKRRRGTILLEYWRGQDGPCFRMKYVTEDETNIRVVLEKDLGGYVMAWPVVCLKYEKSDNNATIRGRINLYADLISQTIGWYMGVFHRMSVLTNEGKLVSKYEFQIDKTEFFDEPDTPDDPGCLMVSGTLKTAYGGSYDFLLRMPPEEYMTLELWNRAGFMMSVRQSSENVFSRGYAETEDEYLMGDIENLFTKARMDAWRYLHNEPKAYLPFISYRMAYVGEEEVRVLPIVSRKDLYSGDATLATVVAMVVTDEEYVFLAWLNENGEVSKLACKNGPWFPVNQFAVSNTFKELLISVAEDAAADYEE